MENNMKSWDSESKLVLWVERVIPKKSTRKLLYELLYGMNAFLPMNKLLPVHKFMQ